jgi:hypothetical protein
VVPHFVEPYALPLLSNESQLSVYERKKLPISLSLERTSLLVYGNANKKSIICYS